MCSASSSVQEYSEERKTKKRKSRDLVESSSKTKNSKQNSTNSDVRENSTGAGTDKQKLGQIKLSSLAIRMYVCVSLTASRANGSKMFCGIILNVDQELEAEVHFLKEVKTSGNECYFVWPYIDNESWLQVNDVVEILKCPVTDNRGHYNF